MASLIECVCSIQGLARTAGTGEYSAQRILEAHQWNLSAAHRLHTDTLSGLESLLCPDITAEPDVCRVISAATCTLIGEDEAHTASHQGMQCPSACCWHSYHVFLEITSAVSILVSRTLDLLCRCCA